MAEFNEARELGWDDEIVQESEERLLLPEGDYKFTVKKIERARFSGSAKVKECNQAKITITIHGEEGDTDIVESIFLLSNFEWKLSQFFLSLGMKKHGEPLRMNWTGAVGKTGNCKVYVNEYISNSGEKRQTNRISKFYAYDKDVDTVIPASPASPAYYAKQTQTGYAQPQGSNFGGAPAWSGRRWPQA